MVIVGRIAISLRSDRFSASSGSSAARPRSLFKVIFRCVLCGPQRGCRATPASPRWLGTARAERARQLLRPADGALTPGKLFVCACCLVPPGSKQTLQPCLAAGLFLSEPPMIRFSHLALSALLLSTSAYAQPPRHPPDSRPQHIVIETRPGAGGTIGADAVAKATPTRRRVRRRSSSTTATTRRGADGGRRRVGGCCPIDSCRTPSCCRTRRCSS